MYLHSPAPFYYFKGALFMKTDLYSTTRALSFSKNSLFLEKNKVHSPIFLKLINHKIYKRRYNLIWVLFLSKHNKQRCLSPKKFYKASNNCDKKHLLC